MDRGAYPDGQSEFTRADHARSVGKAGMAWARDELRSGQPPGVLERRRGGESLRWKPGNGAKW